MKLVWQPHGARRTSSIEVPPLPSLIDWYALGYDPHGKRVLYACHVDDDQRGAELHAFDGAAWTKLHDDRIEMDSEKIEGGSYDTSRRGFVIWGCPFDYDKERRRRANGTLLAADGTASNLATSGDAPVIEPANEEDRIGTFNKSAAFAFDPQRETWVCLTRQGVWELDSSGTWTRKSDGSQVPQQWHGKTGDGFYDPVGKRAVFWMQGRDGGYPLIVLTWNGERLEQVSDDGLPDVHVGLMKLAAQVGPHHEHGIIVNIGGELHAPASSGWRSLGVPANPPEKLEDALLACDLERRMLVLGPGKHHSAGGSNRHRVFYVLRDGAWEQQGSLVSQSVLKGGAYGNCRMAHAAGTWYATSTHSLMAWKFDGEWKQIVDKKAGEKLVKWESLQIVGGEQLHAVSKDGSVHVLDDDRWNRLCDASADFKERTDFVLAVMPDRRLVVWGGENPRKLNDTLFFENKSWRAAKKPSPKPEDFKHGKKDRCWVGTTAVYDTAIGALVRFGYEEVAVLGDDEVWSLHTPKAYKSLVSERSYGHHAVHDPDTGETLLVDFAGDQQAKDPTARLIRFDLGECTLLATIEYPAALARKTQHDAAPFHALAETFSYDPSTKALYAQVLVDSGGVYRLDLGPAFVEAKGLGPRTPKPATASKPKAAKSEKAKPAKKPAKP